MCAQLIKYTSHHTQVSYLLPKIGTFLQSFNTFVTSRTYMSRWSRKG